MNRVPVRKVAIIVLAYLLVFGVVLGKDYWSYHKIDMVIAEAAPNLVASGLSQGQTESISWLMRSVTMELRLEISFLTLMLGITIIAIVHLLTRSQLSNSKASSANAT
jgi:hypothetical protein